MSHQVVAILLGAPVGLCFVGMTHYWSGPIERIVSAISLVVLFAAWVLLVI